MLFIICFLLVSPPAVKLYEKGTNFFENQTDNTSAVFKILDWIYSVIVIMIFVFGYTGMLTAFVLFVWELVTS